jgi:hypothetical protein
MGIDKRYWQQELEEIWEECHNCKYLVEDAIVHDAWNEIEFLRCEHYHEIDKDEVKKELDRIFGEYTDFEDISNALLELPADIVDEIFSE